MECGLSNGQGLFAPRFAGLDAILARKERERRATGGLFCWGIGNSVAPAPVTPLSRGVEPEVLFSPMSGRPRDVDARPSDVVRWLGGLTLDGERYTLPDDVLVTSREKSTAHYVLVCSSPTALAFRDRGEVDIASLRNFGSGRPIGASQVTAIVERSGARCGRLYSVLLEARLAWPYFLRLDQKVPWEGEIEPRRARARLGGLVAGRDRQVSASTARQPASRVRAE